VRSLRGAALLLIALLAPAPSFGQNHEAPRPELIDAALSTPSAWWSQTGLPGWTPDSDFGVAYPWTLAGLVRGAWRTIDDSRVMGVRPPPGLPEMTVPLSWLDSLAIEHASSGAWQGFDGTLGTARAHTGLPEPKTGRQANARADALLAGGSDGFRDDALSVRAGDPRSYLWTEAESMNHDDTGSLGLAGHHMYDIVASRSEGQHRLAAAFSQRGAAGVVVPGLEESATGVSGAIEYQWYPVNHRLTARLARGYDQRESFGGGLLSSHRDAQQNDAEIEFARRDSVEHWALAARASQAEVRRTTDFVTEGGNATSWWTAGRLQQPAGDGMWDLAFGVGRHEGVERFEWAPSIGYRFGVRPFTGRAWIERQVVPVWTDLAPSQTRFLQSAWLGGLEANANATHARGRLSFSAGRVRDRAVVARFPLTDLSLLAGFRADPGDYDFALAEVSGQWSFRGATLGASAFGLTRDAGSVQPRVDPNEGFRAFAEWGFLAFQKDLSVRVRGEAAGVGTREVQSGAPELLPSFVTYGASVIFVLSDVRVTVRGTNLEDKRRPDVWRDFVTGEPALGTGRQIVTSFTWRLFD
jgi:hypothetical protein